MSYEQPAPLYYSYATWLGGHPRVLACRPLRAVHQRLLFRVNSATVVGGPWFGEAWARSAVRNICEHMFDAWSRTHTPERRAAG